MCNKCCKECHGWCRAFTATELLLSILEAALIILFIAFLTFLILHLLVCPDNETNTSQIFNEPVENKSVSDSAQSSEAMQTRTTLSPNIQCTWTPSDKTKALTQYFELSDKLVQGTTVSTKLPIPITEKFLPLSTDDDDELQPDQTDGYIAKNKNVFVLSLVKLTASNFVYGCILTIVSEFWTVTAASCIKSIEEDSLDSFVMIENLEDSTQGRRHKVAEIVMHPQYRGINKMYDIIAIKSEDRIANGKNILKLPTMIDYLLITIGERLLVIGFGKFRSTTNKAPSLNGVFEAAVHMLPTSQCVPPPGVSAGLCAGGLRARGAACRACAGAPLLLRHTLLGLMTDNQLCGLSCQPALYVNIATVTDWLKPVIGDQ